MNKWQKAEADAAARAAARSAEQQTALAKFDALISELRPVLAILDDIPDYTEQMPTYRRMALLQLEGAIYLYDQKIGPEKLPPKP